VGVSHTEHMFQGVFLKDTTDLKQVCQKCGVYRIKSLDGKWTEEELKAPKK
jgi:hypothetical protein